jgi:hypothetical protein
MQPVAPAVQSSTPAAQVPPVQMVQMLAGFQISQALYVAAKLDLGAILQAGPRSPAELAAETGADAGSLRRIMRTLASIGLYAEVDPEVYAATPLGDTLASGAPGSVRDLAITWMETHYAPFARLLDGVRGGECAATLHYGSPFFDWLSRDAEQMARFTGAMADLTNGIKVHALDGYRLPAGELTWAETSSRPCPPPTSTCCRWCCTTGMTPRAAACCPRSPRPPILVRASSHSS